ncbi:hypothetical protein GDO78_022635, partial [Eleutherodactylus coqui]
MEGRGNWHDSNSAHSSIYCFFSGCTFTLLVHTREAATRNMEKIQVIKDFPWILADEQDVHMQEPRLIPLKTMTSDILK